MNADEYLRIVDRALAEDLGEAGDITSQSVIPDDAEATAQIVVRARGVLAGLEVAEAVFRRVDDSVEFTSLAKDGDRVDAGDVVAEVSGLARSLLAAERTALNLLSRMSGVATATRVLVDAVAGTGARITDTRKTMPGLRVLDKYAVTVGGGVNHRMGLYDAVMIKDNHIVAAGDLAFAVAQAREKMGPDQMIIVEVENLDQLRSVLETDADRVLLDNMNQQTLEEAVLMVNGAMATEASGGVTVETVRGIAETGVDLISAGCITHSAPQLDVALDFRPTHPPARDLDSR